MPAYLIRHPAEQRREDVLLSDPALTIDFVDGWAVFIDSAGICFAISHTQGAHIQRIDDPAPAPEDTTT
ncbi:hypothetical protein ACFRFJ_16015 [Streptomyces hydrogenans]|uniref:hypothetical protein n=1 Tax=Streptomyces TaxID=1883 RepID=UPI0036A84121